MRIGIDLGGTKTEVIALGDAGEQLYRHRLPTPRDDYRQTIETIATLVDMAEQATGQRGTVGMGIPGSISPYTGVVKNANSTWLNGQPFDKDLSADSICRDYRHGMRRGRGIQWAGAYRRQWHGRRVGTQSATVDGRRRTALSRGSPLLLR